MSTHPLVEIAEFVRANPGCAVVFDLDSTLFCVSVRTQAILRALGSDAEFRAKFSEAADFLSRCEVLPSDWGVRSVMKRSGLSVDDALVVAVRDFWRRHFFANHYLDVDVIYPAANEYVRHLETLGGRILYLTGRADRLMRVGSEAALRKFGFPLPDSAALYMKPDEVETDEHYKVKVLAELSRSFAHIVFFENEPLIINQVRASLPLVKIVFVDSVHSGRAVAPKDLMTIGMTYLPGLPTLPGQS